MEKSVTQEKYFSLHAVGTGVSAMQKRRIVLSLLTFLSHYSQIKRESTGKGDLLLWNRETQRFETLLTI